MNWTLKAAVLAAMLLLATAGSPKQALVSAVSHNNSGNNMVSEVDFDEVNKLIADPHNFVLDVREAQELKADGAIPGSVNLPLSRLKGLSGCLDDFKKAVGRPIDPSGQNMILSCRSGRRALLAADIIRPLGYAEVRVYKGSFLDWVSKGGKVIKVDQHQESQ